MNRLAGSLALALMIGLWTVSYIEAEPRIEVTGGAPTFQEVALKFAPLQTSPVLIQSFSPLAVLTGHAERVSSVTFSPDGKTLASGGDDKVVRLWDVAQQKQKAVLIGHTSFVSSVAFSPDGKTLASGGGQDPAVRLWDVAQQKQVMSFTGHTGLVKSVAFSPDGKILASGGGEGTVILWDVAQQKQIAVLRGHISGVSTIAFSPDGKTLASGSSDKNVILWDVAQQKQAAVIFTDQFLLSSVAFSPDGKTLASGAGGDKYVLLWDVIQRKNIATLSGPVLGLTSVVFSSDGKILAAGGGDKQIYLWDVEQRKQVATLTGHSSFINSVAFRPDGKMLASGSSDKSIRLWGDKEAAVPPTQEPGSVLPKFGDGTGILDLNPADEDQNVRLIGSVKPGEKFDIQVLLTQEVTEASGFKITMTFDPKKLSVVSGKVDGVFAQAISPGLQTIDNTVSMGGAFLGQNVIAKGAVAVLTFQTASNFTGDAEIVLTELTIRVSLKPQKDFTPQASVVLSSSDVSAGKPPLATLSTSSLKFEDTKVGKTSQKIFTISNTGGGSVSITGITASGPDASQFKVSQGAATLLAGRSQVVTVTFAPTSAGKKSASLSITHNAPGSPAQILLSGATPKKPTLAFQPDTLNFGNVAIGARSVRPVTFYNRGDDALRVEILQDTLVIAPGDSAIFSIAFTPTKAEELKTKISGISNDPDYPFGFSIPASGLGVSLTLSIDLDTADGNQKLIKKNGVRAGQKIPMQIFVDNAPRIKGFTVRINFDPRQVSFVPGSFTAGSLVPGLTSLVDAQRSYVEVGGTSLSGGVGEGRGQLGTVTFEALQGFGKETGLWISFVMWNRVTGGRQDIQTDVQSTLTSAGLPADFSGDGQVDFDDFFLFAQAFGQSAAGVNVKFDLDGDGKVGFGDFFIFGEAFGQKT